MSAYKEIEGNLITLFQQKKFDLIIHGANCFNIMGAGIAKTLSTLYPELLVVDKEYSLPVGNIERLGNYSKLTIGKGREAQWIVNAYSQYRPGQNLDYNGLELSLKKINFNFKPERIGVPGWIGGGIAGGDIRIIRKIVQRSLKDCDVTVVFLPENKNLMRE